MLRAEHIGRSFTAGGFSLVIEHVAIQPGDRIAVTGPSGSGKSTLLAILALALTPQLPLPSGEGGAGKGSAGVSPWKAGGGLGEGQDTPVLNLAGTNALNLWQTHQQDHLAAFRAKHIGFVPQTGALLPFLTLGDNIRLPARILNRPDPARVRHLAQRLGIASLMDRMPSQVSVGQRQRAAVARALAHRPGLVLADEPTASVHPAQADEILSLLTDAAAEDGVALVITTHDEARARAAGYAIAPCRPDADAARTRFAYP